MSMFSIDPASLPFEKTPKTFGIAMSCFVALNLIILLAALVIWNWARVRRFTRWMFSGCLSRGNQYVAADLELGQLPQANVSNKLKCR
jgi:hypothetical protein